MKHLTNTVFLFLALSTPGWVGVILSLAMAGVIAYDLREER